MAKELNIQHDNLDFLVTSVNINEKRVPQPDIYCIKRRPMMAENGHAAHVIVGEYENVLFDDCSLYVCCSIQCYFYHHFLNSYHHHHLGRSLWNMFIFHSSLFCVTYFVLEYYFPLTFISLFSILISPPSFFLLRFSFRNHF